MTSTTLTDQQIKDLMQKPKPTVASVKTAVQKTKLVAINEMRRQAGLDTVSSIDNITVQDKRGWLILQDLWRKDITQEHANELLSVIYQEPEPEVEDAEA